METSRFKDLTAAKSFTAPHSLGKLIEWKLSVSVSHVALTFSSPLAGETN